MKLKTSFSKCTFNNKHDQKMGCQTHPTTISFFETKTLQLYNLQALLIYQYMAKMQKDFLGFWLVAN